MSLQEASPEEVGDPRCLTKPSDDAKFCGDFATLGREGGFITQEACLHTTLYCDLVRENHSSSGRGQNPSITCTCRQHQHSEESEEALRRLLSLLSGEQRASPS